MFFWTQQGWGLASMIFDDQSLGLKEMEGVTTSRFGEVATKLRGGVYIWIAYRDYTGIM